MNYSSAIRFIYRAYPFRKGRNRLRSFAMRHIRGVIIGKDQFGNGMLLNLDSLMDCMVYLDGANELPAMKELKRWVDSGPCDTFIDIGANIGSFTLFFSQHTKLQRLYAFEPDPGNHAQLVANIWLNEQRQRIQPFEMALSDESGMAVLYRPKGRQSDEFLKYNMGTSGLDRYPRRHDNSEKIEVAKRRLDDVLNLSGNTIAIKIDVEGHEYSVLKGMQDLLRNNECGLIMEVWSRNEDNSRAVNALLAGLGYTRVNTNIEPDTHLYVKQSALRPSASSLRQRVANA